MVNVVLEADSDEADVDGARSEVAYNRDGFTNDDDATEGEVSWMMAPEIGESLEVIMFKGIVVPDPLDAPLINIKRVSTHLTRKPLRARMAEQFNAVAWDIEREILLKD